MKATVNLDDRLYRKVKVKAAQDGVTVTSIFEAALERFLAESTSTRESRVELPLLEGNGGLLPGVDLAHGETVYRILDQDTPLDQRP